MVRKEQPLKAAPEKRDRTGPKITPLALPNLSNAISVMALGQQQFQQDTLEGAVGRKGPAFHF